MAYFRYRNRNTNNRLNSVRFNQPFSFRRKEKVEVEDKLPLNMIISEPASRDQVCQYSTLQECLANSGTTSTKTESVQQGDIFNNYPHSTQYGETNQVSGTPIDPNITFNYRDDINYDLNSTSGSESGLRDRSFISSDRSSIDNDVCPTKCPEKRRHLQRTESDILKNIKYKNYVPRVQPFLAVFSPKKKKSATVLKVNSGANKVTDKYSVQPYFEWSKQKFLGQKRRHESESGDPLYKLSKTEDNRLNNRNIPATCDTNCTWKPKENNEESADITFLYKSFNQLPYTSPMNDTNSSFQFVPSTCDEELKG